jgi:hypothetical protein
VFTACTVMDGYTYPLPDAGAAAEAAPQPDAGDYASHVLASGPIAYYRFDEPGGSSIAHDSSGNGHDCQYAAGVMLGVPGIVPGDTAVRFGGPDMGVSCDPTLFAFTGNAPFSIEGWVAPDTVGSTYQTTFSRLTGNPRSGYDVYLYGSPPTINFEIWGSGSSAGKVVCYADGTQFPCGAAAEGGATCGQFVHVAVTYDGATLSMYVNGVLSPTPGSCPTGLPTIGNYAFTIGNYTGETCACGLLGDVDEVAIYDRALPLSEIQDHYAAAGR